MEWCVSFLNRLPEFINKTFDVLDLFLVRAGITGLAVLGLYHLFKNHP